MQGTVPAAAPCSEYSRKRWRSADASSPSALATPAIADSPHPRPPVGYVFHAASPIGQAGGAPSRASLRSWMAGLRHSFTLPGCPHFPSGVSAVHSEWPGPARPSCKRSCVGFPRGGAWAARVMLGQQPLPWRERVGLVGILIHSSRPATRSLDKRASEKSWALAAGGSDQSGVTNGRCIACSDAGGPGSHQRCSHNPDLARSHRRRSFRRGVCAHRRQCRLSCACRLCPYRLAFREH